MQAKTIIISGKVQGVGFRPFIFNLAHKHNLTGWVQNKTGQVEIRVQGHADAISTLEQELIQQHPPLAQPYIVQSDFCDVEKLEQFSILPSQQQSEHDIHIPTDFFTCNDCLDELLDPNGRRYRYPFINCTQCGPRYTLIKKLPYDRPNTSMNTFPLCAACKKEYLDPFNRRFHAQPIACPDCGPALQYKSNQQTISDNEGVLTVAHKSLAEGKILAVKGIGGYHLICDAHNEQAIQTLRTRKNRPDKPFAVLFPWQDNDGLGFIKQHLESSKQHHQQLLHPSRPIVLCNKLASSSLPDNIAPGLNEIGAMLPHSPLHFLLSHDFNKALIATSANFSGEPVLTDNTEVESRLDDIADAFIHHNRPILRPADDSVLRIINKRKHTIRPGRGIAPVELNLPFRLEQPLLAVGGHMKNNIALAWDNRIVISPHIGDLGSARSMKIFNQVISDLQDLYMIQPQHVICDAHPDYASTRWAQDYCATNNYSLEKVFHHHAHASSLCGEYPDQDNWLVFTWDGTGFGADNTIWGGEALLGHAGNWQRVASFEPLSLLGGDKASLQPWRSAATMAWTSNLEWSPGNINSDIDFARQAFTKRMNCHQSSAVGRLFDAAACFILKINQCSFDGQAPMQLEQISDALHIDLAIPLPLQDHSQLLRTNWHPLLQVLLDDNITQSKRSAIFHSTMAMALVTQALTLRKQQGDFAIGLSGGVFQNKKLTEFIIHQLTKENFRVFLSDNIPCNDAGISYGQIINAHHQLMNH